MLNIDTHIVLHYLEGRLKPKEAEAIGTGPRGISAIVLWEIAKLYQLGRISRNLNDPLLAEFIAHCHIWPLDSSVALASTQLDIRSDPADEIIAATSIVFGVPLLTRDERILASRITPLLRFD